MSHACWEKLPKFRHKGFQSELNFQKFQKFQKKKKKLEFRNPKLDLDTHHTDTAAATSTHVACLLYRFWLWIRSSVPVAVPESKKQIKGSHFDSTPNATSQNSAPLSFLPQTRSTKKDVNVSHDAPLRTSQTLETLALVLHISKPFACFGNLLYVLTSSGCFKSKKLFTKAVSDLLG